MNKIKVVFKKPNCDIEILEIENDYKSIQNLVGGYFEIVYIDKYILICNEEGKIKNLQPNLVLGTDVIVGNIIMTKAKGENFVSLNNEEILDIKKNLKRLTF